MIDDRVASVMSGAVGVVLDKDGTLVDLDTRWWRFFSDLVDGITTRSGDDTLRAALTPLLGLTDTGLVADGPAAVESGDEIGARIVVEMVQRGHDAGSARSIVHDAADRAQFGSVQPIGDVDRALRTLGLAGLRLGLATSDGAANTREELETLRLTDVFDPICCADDGGPIKPDPAVLIGIAVAWDVAVADIVFVGDSRQDLATARSAGARFVARCDPDATPAWATDEADAIVAEITELAHHVGANETEVHR